MLTIYTIHAGDGDFYYERFANSDLKARDEHSLMEPWLRPKEKPEPKEAADACFEIRRDDRGSLRADFELKVARYLTRKQADLWIPRTRVIRKDGIAPLGLKMFLNNAYHCWQLRAFRPEGDGGKAFDPASAELFALGLVYEKVAIDEKNDEKKRERLEDFEDIEVPKRSENKNVDAEAAKKGNVWINPLVLKFSVERDGRNADDTPRISPEMVKTWLSERPMLDLHIVADEADLPRLKLQALLWQRWIKCAQRPILPRLLLGKYWKQPPQGSPPLPACFPLLDLMGGTFLIDDFAAPGEKRKALMRAKLFGEFLLGTPRDMTPLGRRDRSIIAGLVFELLYHEDPKDVRLAELLPAADLKLATKLVEILYQAVRAQTDDLLASLQSYFADVRDVTELLSELRVSDGDGWVTFVNATIADRADEIYNGKHPDDEKDPFNFEPIYESALNKDIPPPGIVYVTRQAFTPTDQNHSLKLIATKLKTGESAPFYKKDKKTNIAEGAPTAQLGWPLYVGRRFEASDDLPAITVDVDKLWTLILVLLGKRPQSDKELKEQAKIFRAVTGLLVTPTDKFSSVWLKYLEEGAPLGPVLASYTVAHAIAVRQIAKRQKDTQTLPNFGDSLTWAVGVVGKRFASKSPPSEDWLRKQIWWWGDSKWLCMNTKNLSTFASQRKTATAKEQFLVVDKNPSITALPSANLVERFELIHPRS